ncbi:MAG: serine/threonine-protein kinase [Planctomycetota bacterium]|jgi:serine/threonine-protein kinase
MAETVDTPDQPDKPSDNDRDPLIRTTLGGDKIVGILGRGGYAVVYRALQVQLGREVALKVLTEDETGVLPEQVEAFLREARAAAALNHPCLVHVHDVGEAEGRHFLSMELVPGGNLAQYLRATGAVPWRDAVPIIRDVAEALQCAHEHGLVHRDIKPANVLLTQSGRAKLADLGLAAEQKHAGTAAFMAPEQVMRRKVGRRSDLYSLGCFAFSMLTGRPPFDYPSSKQMLAAHVREPAPSIRSQGVKVPQELERLMGRLLAKLPAERPYCAKDVIDALDRLESGASMQPTRALRARRTRRQRSRSSSSRVMAVVVVIVVLLIGVAAAFAWRHFKQVG